MKIALKLMPTMTACIAVEAIAYFFSKLVGDSALFIVAVALPMLFRREMPMGRKRLSNIIFPAVGYLLFQIVNLIILRSVFINIMGRSKSEVLAFTAVHILVYVMAFTILSILLLSTWEFLRVRVEDFEDR